MDKVALAVSLLLCLFLVSRGMPVRSWPVVIAGTLAIVLLVVLLERNGYWPSGWQVR